MNNKWYNFEGLDRCSMVLQQLEHAFISGDHPSLDTYEKSKLYHTAVEALADLYQKIGEKEFGDED
ncbi:hypothetical protein [Pseudomonas phage vB_PsaM_M1]|nr:hypothetical protein [Pseudomonas phage vB_PsaM_M1]